MKIKISFLGTPVGWSGYNIDKSDLDLYQTYDAPSQHEFDKIAKKHRDRTVYVFGKRSNMVTSGGRGSANFCIAVSVWGGYCTDPESLFELLKLVWDKMVEENLLAKTSSGKYKINFSSFDSVAGQMDACINIIEKNIKKELSKDFANGYDGFNGIHAGIETTENKSGAVPADNKPVQKNQTSMSGRAFKYASDSLKERVRGIEVKKRKNERLY
jgi:hypothetical protein